MAITNRIFGAHEGKGPLFVRSGYLMIQTTELKIQNHLPHNHKRQPLDLNSLSPKQPTGLFPSPRSNSNKPFLLPQNNSQKLLQNLQSTLRNPPSPQNNSWKPLRAPKNSPETSPRSAILLPLKKGPQPLSLLRNAERVASIFPASFQYDLEALPLQGIRSRYTS